MAFLARPVAVASPDSTLSVSSPLNGHVVMGIPARSLRKTLSYLAGAALTCALLVGLSVAFVDRPVATWVHEHLGNPRFGWFSVAYRGASLQFGPFSLAATPAEAIWLLAPLAFAVLAIAASAGAGSKWRGRIALALCVSVLVANQITGLLKLAFGRTWPESLMGNNPSWIRDGAFGFSPFHGGGGWDSFPSGHATMITSFATILCVVWPEFKAVWATIVALVVVGLIGGNYHFVSDIIGGLFLGAGIGLGIATLLLSPNAEPTETVSRSERVHARE